MLYLLLCLSIAQDAVQFTAVTADAGIQFQHVNGATGRKYLVETMGVGAAFVDYDGDGHLDLYLINGTHLPLENPIHEPDEANAPPINRLYRNNGDGTFTDVTAAAGVGDSQYGLACCVGDYDNDGDKDIYVANFGQNVLYRNNGDGTFTDVTQSAGVGDDGFAGGCAFADYDNDGFLDLFVANYVQLDFVQGGGSNPTQPPLGKGRSQVLPLSKGELEGVEDLRQRVLAQPLDCSEKGIPAYCRPEDYPPAPDVLYRNNGDSTFTDVTQATGITRLGRGLGVVWGDVDNDGWIDLYVANDRTENFLYRNNEDGSFTEVGELHGVALNEHALAESGMGVDAGDYDNDGTLDLVVTNYQMETNTLYQNAGDGIFWDVTAQARLSEPTLIPLAWGTGFADFDNDGWLDLFFANGHLHDNIEALEEVGTYKQQNQVFRNVEGGRFVEISDSCGAGLRIEKSSRGAIFGDYDNDGDIDVLVMNIGESPDLLRNDTVHTNHWIGVTLVGTRSNRDGIGARVTFSVGEKQLIREVKSGSSYLSQNDMRILVGLGTSRTVERLTVRWPSGTVDTVQSLDADRWLTIREGHGIILSDER